MLYCFRNTQDTFNMINYRNLFLLFLGISLWSCPLFGNAGESPATVSFPIAMHVDLDYYINTGCYLKCQGAKYDMPYNDILLKDEEVATILQPLIRAIVNDDFATAKSVAWKASPAANQKHEELVQAWMRSCREMFLNSNIAGSNFDFLNVIGNFYIGDRILFACEVKNHGIELTKSRPFSLYFKQIEQDRIVWDVNSPPTTISLVNETLRQRAESPSKFLLKEGLATMYEIPIPGTLSGRKVYLQFDGGKKYDFSLLTDKADSSEEVLCFYQKKFHAARDGRRQDIAEMYTNKSREKFLNWLETGNKSYLDWYFQHLGNSERHVRFVINAEPLFVILSQGVPVTTLIPEYAIRDQADGKLKLTNFYIRGFLEKLLEDIEFLKVFNEFVLQ